MGYLADIYVIHKDTTKKQILEFLDYFVPNREELCNEYWIQNIQNIQIMSLIMQTT